MAEFYDIRTNERVYDCPKCHSNWDQQSFQRLPDDLDPLNPERPYLRVLQDSRFLMEVRRLALRHDLFSDVDPACAAIGYWITDCDHNKPPHEWCMRALENGDYLRQITSVATSACAGATGSKPLLDASVGADRLKIEALRAWIADRDERRGAALAASVIPSSFSAEGGKGVGE
jgi:hypothetical protein